MENNNIPKWVSDALVNLKDDVKSLRKSYGVINEHSGDLKNDVGKIKTDVDWLKRFFWIVATSSIGALGASIINLISTSN